MEHRHLIVGHVTPILVFTTAGLLIVPRLLRP